MANYLLSLGNRLGKAVAFVGRHPTAVLVLPSLWLLLRYLPFWKDIDATVQLIARAYDDNILHFPPIYSFLARIPFLVVDTLLHGHAPGVFDRQEPSIAAVYGLVVVQHVALWIALRYFLLSFPARDSARGLVTVLLASMASFYAFAHTCGSEAATPITYFLIFGAGIRALLRRATWRTWVIYTVALFLAMGARHINLLILLWLPGTALVSILWPVLLRSRPLPSISMRTMLAALFSGLVAFGAEKLTISQLCHQFGLTERSSLGSAMSDRIATWVDRLSVEQRRALMDSAQRLTADPLVKLAIQFQIEVGSYDKGTGAALAAALSERGLSGEQLLVEKDKLISQSSLCFYRTFDLGLVKEMLTDFWHGFVPTDDQGIAIAAPKATFFSLERIDQSPGDWVGVSELPIFVPANAKATLTRATEDDFIRHWRWMPILAWTVLFVGIGCYRVARGGLPGSYLLIGLSILGVGTLVYGANCVCIYTLPRYALPLLVSVIAFGGFVSAAVSALEPGSPEKN